MEEIESKLKELSLKWKGKSPPPYMSPEYIERRMDRLRYFRLKRLQKELEEKNKTDGVYKEAQKVFDL